MFTSGTQEIIEKPSPFGFDTIKVLQSGCSAHDDQLKKFFDEIKSDLDVEENAVAFWKARAKANNFYLYL